MPGRKRCAKIARLNSAPAPSLSLAPPIPLLAALRFIRNGALDETGGERRCQVTTAEAWTMRESEVRHQLCGGQDIVPKNTQKPL